MDWDLRTRFLSRARCSVSELSYAPKEVKASYPSIHPRVTASASSGCAGAMPKSLPASRAGSPTFICNGTCRRVRVCGASSSSPRGGVPPRDLIPAPHDLQGVRHAEESAASEKLELSAAPHLSLLTGRQERTYRLHGRTGGLEQRRQDGGRRRRPRSNRADTEERAVGPGGSRRQLLRRI